MVLGVFYTLQTNNWNNLSKKKKITSDTFFFLLLLGYKDTLCVNGIDGTLVPFGQ